MKPTIPHLIEKAARGLHLEVHGSPFHAAEGFELRKQIGNTDTLICIGCFYGPQVTTIYRRTESKKNLFLRNRLWFLLWIIKPAPCDNQYKALQEVSRAEFNENLFVDVVKKELDAQQASSV